MPERSVAEIIGWRHTNWPEPYAGWRDARGQLRGDPTVDDLLAWLRSQGVWVDEWVWDDEHEEYFVLTARRGEPTVGRRAPTLLAALEAAVRAVAE